MQGGVLGQDKAKSQQHTRDEERLEERLQHNSCFAEAFTCFCLFESETLVGMLHI